MATKVVRIDVFISSPSDVALERGIVRRVIERFNRSVLRDKYFIVPLLYEDDVPPQVGQDAQLIVDRYMRVQQSQVLVCMLWSRMGTPFTIAETGDQFESGTQYEFVHGYESYARQGHPNILLYRKVKENPEADPQQRNRVDAFFNAFQGPQPRWKGLWSEYAEVDQFEEKVSNDLERVIRGLEFDERTPQWMDPPQFEEEPRRLDAAMPQAAALNEPTELKAMICLPDSAGLAALLPEEPDDAREIGQEDVREGSLMIAFPKDARSGKLQPTQVMIELEATDFQVEVPRQTVRLSPGHDSGTVCFSLTPLRARQRSRVVVRVKARALDGGEYLCGSTVLSTEVQTTKIRQIGHAIWKLATLRLGAAPTSPVPQQGVQAYKREMLDLLPSPSSEPIEPRMPSGHRSAQAERWVLLFSPGLPQVAFEQLGLLGGKVGVCDPDGYWWLVWDLHECPKIQQGDPSDETGPYWFNEDPSLLQALAIRLSALGFPTHDSALRDSRTNWTRYLTSMVIFLPEQVVEELQRLELEYQGAKEEDILRTTFRIVGQTRPLRIEVDEQLLR